MEALKAQDPNKVYKWDYICGQYGPFTQNGANRTYVAGGVNPPAWGGGGMQSWGQTCGILIAAAAICQMVNKRNQIDEVFTSFGQIAHPMTEVGNSEWLRDRVAANLPKPTVVVPPSILGSLQCHNALEEFQRAVVGIPGYTRSDGCARLCADLAYITVKVLDKQFNGTAGYATPAVSTARAECATAGCHNGGTAATTVVGKENCWVCHK
jgi:hypothetical protein